MSTPVYPDLTETEARALERLKRLADSNGNIPILIIREVDFYDVCQLGVKDYLVAGDEVDQLKLSDKAL